MYHNLILVSGMTWWFAILDLEGQVTFFEYRDYNTCNISYAVYKRVLPVNRIVPCQSQDNTKPLEKQHMNSGTEDAT